MFSLSRDSSLADKTYVLVAILITLALTAAYHFSVGLLGIWPDSLVYADRARHLLSEGNLALGFPASGSYPPIYSLLMACSFFIGSWFVPSFMAGHTILIVLHILLVSSTFFPIRRLLLTHTQLSKLEACIMAVVAALLATTLPYVSMLSAEALFISLFVWFTGFYDKFLNEQKRCPAIESGVLLGLLLLTKEVGWTVYLAVLANTLLNLRKAKPSPHLLLIPLAFVGVWVAYNVGVLGKPFELPQWELNNPLARFNFMKNSLLYLCYAGMPLAGLALMVSTISKKTAQWEQPFYRFTVITLLLVIAYTMLSNAVIVERRLDYITNRAIEPFVLLPLVVFFRLGLDQRKQLLANGMLIFFCFAIFGLPYGLKTDFQTGVSYWAQSMENANLGIIRNVMYFLLISLPVSIIWWQPKWFVPSFILVALIINSANILQDQAHWTLDQDSSFKFVNADGFANNPDMKNATAIYAENKCIDTQSNDIAYLYRCNDLTKMQYFMPQLVKPLSPDQLANLTLKDGQYVLYASSEADNYFGPAAGVVGLGRFAKLYQKDIDALKQQPVVRITSVERLGRYINVNLNNFAERVTLLGPDAVFHVTSSKAGCMAMLGRMAANPDQDTGDQLRVEFFLNGKSLRKSTFGAVTNGVIAPEFSYPLNLKEGENSLSIKYKLPDDNASQNVHASLFMFARPVFKPCEK